MLTQISFAFPQHRLCHCLSDPMEPHRAVPPVTWSEPAGALGCSASPRGSWLFWLCSANTIKSSGRKDHRNANRYVHFHIAAVQYSFFLSVCIPTAVHTQTPTCVYRLCADCFGLSAFLIPGSCAGPEGMGGEPALSPPSGGD